MKAGGGEVQAFFKQCLPNRAGQGWRLTFSSLLRKAAGGPNGSGMDVLGTLGASAVGTNWGLW